MWQDSLRFTIHTPELALVRFVVEDYDKTSKNDFVGQYTVPLTCMQQGSTQRCSWRMAYRRKRYICVESAA